MLNKIVCYDVLNKVMGPIGFEKVFNTKSFEKERPFLCDCGRPQISKCNAKSLVNLLKISPIYRRHEILYGRFRYTFTYYVCPGQGDIKSRSQICGSAFTTY